MIALDLLELEGVPTPRCDGCHRPAAYRLLVTGPAMIEAEPTVPARGAGTPVSVPRQRVTGGDMKLCYQCVEAMERIFAHGGGRYSPEAKAKSEYEMLLEGMDS